jgi:hypothetical protein
MAAMNVSSDTMTAHVPNEVSNTSASVQAGQIRGAEQASLDNACQAMSRRRTTSAYYATRCTSFEALINVSSLSQETVYAACRAELDSHTDTCGVNNVARIFSYTGKIAHVSAYSPKLDTMKNIPIVRAALAYDDASTGETYVLIINQALYFGNALPHKKNK